MKRLGKLDRAVGPLAVLQQRDDRASHRDRGSVQRVRGVRALAGAHADVQAPSLVGGRVRARGELAVAALPRQPSFTVVLLRRRGAEVPYRVVNIAVSDLGASAAKKYDCEAWLPSQRRYRELTSCSNTTDFQARRLNIRVRGERGKGGQPMRTLHTLNGTAVAVGRTIVALLENGQRADRGVDLPECLVPYGAPTRLQAA